MESTPGMQPQDDPMQSAEGQSPSPAEPEAVSSAPTPEPFTASQSEPKAEEAGAAAPTPTPEPPAPDPPAAESPIASTVSVPADPNASDNEGGEWHLMMEKLNAWLADAKLMELWQQSQRPLKLVGGALALLLVLQLTSAVLGTLDAIPMLPRLLQLTGLIYVVLFASRRLVRSDERRSLIEGVKNGWSSFTGK